MIKTIIKYYLTNKKINFVIKIFLFIFISIIFLLVLLLLLSKGYNLKDYFQINKNLILLLFIGYVILTIGYILYLRNKYNKLLEDKPKEVYLKDIASLWLVYNRKETINKEKNEIQIKPNDSDKYIKSDDKIYENINYNNNKIERFFKTMIVHRKTSFTTYEMNLIIELLKSLDKYGATTSSVASSYKNDIENVRLKEKVILEYNSKTNYTILQNIMMDEHTLNVCYKIIELYEGSESKTNVTYADIIIAALSHDFGKLIKQVDELIPINTTILQEKSHFEISALYLERVGSELEHLEVIVSAVLNHHSIKEPDAYLSNLLFNADREARSIETKKFLKNKGEKIFDSKIEKKEKVNEEFNAKDGTFNDVKKIDIPIKVINKIEDELKKNINKTTIKNQNGDLLLDRTKINSSFINSISQDDKCYVRFSFFISLTANILKTFCDNNSITDLQDELISYFKEEKIIDNKDKNTVKIEFYDIKDKMIGVENFMKFNLEKLDVDPSEALLKKDKVDLLNNIYIKEV